MDENTTANAAENEATQAPNADDTSAADSTVTAEVDPAGDATVGSGVEDSRPEEDDAVRRLRQEAAKYRTRLREQEKQRSSVEARLDELTKGLARLAGVGPEEQADPEKLLEATIAERDAARRELEAYRVGEAVKAAAVKAGADTDLLLPFMRGVGQFEDLDPSAEDFSSLVEERVQALVDAHPQLRAQVVPRSSGGVTNPKPESGGRVSQEQVDAWAAAGDWASINKAVREGRI